jgi:hypothetical protein
VPTVAVPPELDPQAAINRAARAMADALKNFNMPDLPCRKSATTS